MDLCANKNIPHERCLTRTFRTFLFPCFFPFKVLSKIFKWNWFSLQSRAISTLAEYLTAAWGVSIADTKKQSYKQINIKRRFCSWLRTTFCFLKYLTKNNQPEDMLNKIAPLAFHSTIRLKCCIEKKDECVSMTKITAVILTITMLRFCFHNSCFTQFIQVESRITKIADIKLNTFEG